jgi:hypothetical protein
MLQDKDSGHTRSKFIAGRFLIGFGQSFTSIATLFLMVEIIPSSQRSNYRPNGSNLVPGSKQAALVMEEINQINELGQEGLTEDDHGHKLA